MYRKIKAKKKMAKVGGVEGGLRSAKDDDGFGNVELMETPKRKLENEKPELDLEGFEDDFLNDEKKEDDLDDFGAGFLEGGIGTVEDEDDQEYNF